MGWPPCSRVAIWAAVLGGYVRRADSRDGADNVSACPWKLLG